MKRLAIVGGAGRMGQAMAAGLSSEPDFDVVALVDVAEPRDLFQARYAQRVEDVDADGVDAVVDFSTPEGVLRSAQWCAEHRVPLVVGATGLGEETHEALRAASASTPVVVASNFSLGAVLSERFAAMAAPYFDRVEIIELHHDRKADAPSGTSLTTARAIGDALGRAGRSPLDEPTKRTTLEGARGGDAGAGVRIHSVRLPGLVAHQEVLFGATGEGLTIRHDSYDRSSFVHGVALALRHMPTTPGLTSGIDGFVA